MPAPFSIIRFQYISKYEKDNLDFPRHPVYRFDMVHLYQLPLHKTQYRLPPSHP